MKVTLNNINHKYRMNRDFAVKDFSSLKNNKYTDQTPLIQEYSQPSFKGVSSIFKGLWQKRTKYGQYKEAVELLRKHYNSSSRSIKKVINNNRGVSGNVNIDQAANTIEIREKGPVRLIIEGIYYPFVQLPMHIVDGFIDILRKKQILPQNFGKNPNTWYGKVRNALDNDDKLNSIIGYVKSANKYKYDRPEIQSASLFKDGMKMFETGSGNYNGVHERALTRIVTGFIPAFFLANDAYNLSRLCDDNPKEAEKEKKLRFNQETKRVVSNAHIQLITLGALSKFINSSKKAFVAVTVVTTIATEMFSRLTNGKKIHFISKEEAKKINEQENKTKKPNDKRADKVEQNDSKQKDITTQANSKPGFKGSSVFKAFEMDNFKTFENNIRNSVELIPQNSKELKPLLNMKTIGAWIGGTIAIGYGLRAGKVGFNKLIQSNFGKNNELVKQMAKLPKISDNIVKGYNKIYKFLTTQDHIITRAEFDDIIKKLNIYDKVLGSKYKQVVDDYHLAQTLRGFATELKEEIAALGNDMSKYINVLEEISSKPVSKILTKEARTKNFEHFYQKLCEFGNENIANEIKELFFDAERNIAEKNYTQIVAKLKDFINKSDNPALKPLLRAFDNVYKVNHVGVNLNLYKEIIEKLKLNGQINIARKYEKLMQKAANSELINIGTKNRFIYKELVDFMIRPINFIWNTIRFPYKAVKNIEKMYDAPKLPEWTNEIKIISNSISKIRKTYDKVEKHVLIWNQKATKHNLRIANTQKEKIEYKNVSKEFAKIMNKQISKAFNDVTISKLSNSELSELAKYSTTAATSWFLIADNYNMVMLKSNGENKQEAGMKAKERALQETSRLFYSQLLINLFNSTFSNVYNSSLLGAQSVNTASTLLGEYFNRKAIGVPTKAMSRDEIIKQDEENINSKGAKGKFFRFMSRLTGKRALSMRNIPKQEQK